MAGVIILRLDESEDINEALHVNSLRQERQTFAFESVWSISYGVAYYLVELFGCIILFCF